MRYLIIALLPIFVACSAKVTGPTGEALPDIPGAPGPQAPGETDGKKDGPPAAATPVPVTNNYTEASKDQCLNAWNWKAVRYATCSNQGSFAFFEVESADATDPYTLKLKYVLRDGRSIAFGNPRVTTGSSGNFNISLSSTDYDLRFEGANQRKPAERPNFGYVVFAGNSGECQPLVAGSWQSCNKKFKESGSYSDRIPTDYFSFPKDSVVQVGPCLLKAGEKDLYTSTARFQVTVAPSGAKCEIAGRTYNAGNTVEFDLADSRNYPLLTVPAR